MDTSGHAFLFVHRRRQYSKDAYRECARPRGGFPDCPVLGPTNRSPSLGALEAPMTERALSAAIVRVPHANTKLKSFYTHIT